MRFERIVMVELADARAVSGLERSPRRDHREEESRPGRHPGQRAHERGTQLPGQLSGALQVVGREVRCAEPRVVAHRERGRADPRRMPPEEEAGERDPGPARDSRGDLRHKNRSAHGGERVVIAAPRVGHRPHGEREAAEPAQGERDRAAHARLPRGRIRQPERSHGEQREGDGRRVRRAPRAQPARGVLDPGQRLGQMNECRRQARGVELEPRRGRGVCAEPRFADRPWHHGQRERQHATQRRARGPALHAPGPEEEHRRERQRGFLGERGRDTCEPGRPQSPAPEERQRRQRAGEREEILCAGHPQEIHALEREQRVPQHAGEHCGGDDAPARLGAFAIAGFARGERGEQVGEQHERRREERELGEVEDDRLPTGERRQHGEPSLARERSKVVAEPAGVDDRVHDPLAPGLLQEQVVVVDEPGAQRAGIEREHPRQHERGRLPAGERSVRGHGPAI